jgi:hypothetical protein
MKGRKHRATGGVNEDAQDKSKKNLRYTYQSNVNDAAEERKRGGMVEKKGGGMIHGAAAKKHAGRKARKSGGRASCESNPFTSAKAGTPPKGRTMDGNVGG